MFFQFQLEIFLDKSEVFIDFVESFLCFAGVPVPFFIFWGEVGVPVPQFVLNIQSQYIFFVPVIERIFLRETFFILENKLKYF